jgi:hypothetical protein
MAIDQVIGHEATDAQGGPAAVGVMRLSLVRAEQRQEHNDWLTERLFEETTARHDAEFDYKALGAEHATVVTAYAQQGRDLDYWRNLGGWLLLAACSGWLFFGLVVIAVARGVL